MKNDLFRLVVAANIKRLRAKEGWTQLELADRINMPQSVLSRYESGHTDMGIDGLARFAAFFGCRISDLFVVKK